ncbi:MAG: cobalt-precorrin-5B (C(1))-methyltransferase CbiD [Clostridiales bacterium]
MNEYIVKSGKKLRKGFTTGSCAAAASKACAIMLFEKKIIQSVQLRFPDSREFKMEIDDAMIHECSVSCCVAKDAGDDPDVTNGIKIYARVNKSKKGIKIDGGIGVGRVINEGLPCKIGEAAINPEPRKMIKKSLEDVAQLYGYEGGFNVEIFVPQGEEIAKKTFNERLGILGGISILGTTGIVEPMSESALVETIKIELNSRKKSGQDVLLISPGNYGVCFARDNLELDIENAVKCSNFIGEVLDYSCYLGFEKILFVGHIGKLVKVAAGVMNTHSKIADCRNEVFSAHCGLAGANKATIEKVMNAKTTNEIHNIIMLQDIDKLVYESILKRIVFHMNYRVMNKIKIELIVFSTEHGLLMQTDNAIDFINELRDIQKINSNSRV